MLVDKYEVPKDLYYSKEHEWARLNDEYVTVGITDYAQKSLHEIVYVELPEVGVQVKQMEMFGTVESVKAVSDIYSPISGIIIEVNEVLIDKPEILNIDPYDEGWIAKIKPRRLKEDLKNLMNYEEYIQYLQTLEK